MARPCGPWGIGGERLHLAYRHRACVTSAFAAQSVHVLAGQPPGPNVEEEARQAHFTVAHMGSSKNPAPDDSGAGQDHKLCQYIRG